MSKFTGGAMDLNTIFQAGMQREATFVVDEQHSASQVGSGSLRVLATPIMIAQIEKNSHLLLVEHLPPGYSSVGAQIFIRHLAPSPIGSTVRLRSEIQLVDGLRVQFYVQAWDQDEEIGTGEHTRFVIEEDRFLRRVAAKAARLDGSA
jgi:fluoroacetyl-CoA thioesterase